MLGKQWNCVHLILNIGLLKVFLEIQLVLLPTKGISIEIIPELYQEQMEVPGEIFTDLIRDRMIVMKLWKIILELPLFLFICLTDFLVPLFLQIIWMIYDLEYLLLSYQLTYNFKILILKTVDANWNNFRNLFISLHNFFF